MTANLPAPQSRWIYTGPGEGRGIRHTVVWSEPEVVVTWSEPFQCRGGDGQSWLGSPDLFEKHFHPPVA